MLALSLNAVGLLPVSPGVEMLEGRPPLPHHFVCVETVIPYLTFPYAPEAWSAAPFATLLRCEGLCVWAATRPIAD